MRVASFLLEGGKLYGLGLLSLHPPNLSELRLGFPFVCAGNPYLDSMREKFSHIPIEEHEREVARAVQEAWQELRQERAAEVATPGVA